MSEIVEAIRGYAEGQSSIEETLNVLRQIEPTVPDPNNPYIDDLTDDEGSFGDIATGCILYDCTAEEYELFRLALSGTRIGPREEPQETSQEESEETPIEKSGLFTAPIEIAKSDSRKNLVFGWANVTINDGNQVVDHQGHMIDVDDLESAAYNFAVKYRKTGDSHAGEGFGDLVESLVVTEDKIEKGGFPEEMLGKWWVGFKVPDEDWDRVERGERSMFSIQGRAQLEAI